MKTDLAAGQKIEVEFPTLRSAITALHVLQGDYWGRVCSYRWLIEHESEERAARVSSHVQAAADAINALRGAMVP